MAGLWNLAASKTKITDSLPVNAVFKDDASLPGGLQGLDRDVAMERKTEAEMQNFLSVEEGKADLEGREERPKNLLLGALTDNNDNASVTFGLDTIFNIDTFLMALLLMATLMGIFFPDL